MKDRAGTSVINVKINEDNEIELLEVNELAESDLENEDEAGEEISEDDDPELVPNKDGTMSIKIADKTKMKTIVEHVCGRCSKTYSTYAALKRHQNLCRNLPKDEMAHDVKDFSNIDVHDPEYEVYCFCCNEDKSTAHVRSLVLHTVCDTDIHVLIFYAFIVSTVTSNAVSARNPSNRTSAWHVICTHCTRRIKTIRVPVVMPPVRVKTYWICTWNHMTPANRSRVKIAAKTSHANTIWIGI